MGLEDVVRSAWRSISTFAKRFTAGIVEGLDIFGTLANTYQKLAHKKDRFHPDSWRSISQRVFRWAYPKDRGAYTWRSYIPKFLGNLIVAKGVLGYFSYVFSDYFKWMVPDAFVDFCGNAADNLGLPRRYGVQYAESHGAFFVPGICFGLAQTPKVARHLFRPKYHAAPAYV